MTEKPDELVDQVRRYLEAPPDHDRVHPEDPIYIALIACRAENYILALRAGENDVFDRHASMVGMLSAHVVLELCRAWQWKRRRLREDEQRELEVEP